MKKIAGILLAVVLSVTNVNAASLCSYKETTELNKIASNVKATYEMVEKTIHFDDKDATKEVVVISIFNITEKVYVVVKNNYDIIERTYTFKDTKEGIAEFEWENLDKVTNFTIEVYTTNKTNCPYERLKTTYLITPRFNEYFNREACNENPDFYLCQKYVNFKEVDETSFLNQLENYKKGNIDDSGEKVEEPELTMIDKIINFINNYKLYILGGIAITISLSLIIYRSKTKKQRDLGL